MTAQGGCESSVVQGEQRMRILIVEDDGGIAEVVTFVLQQDGYETQTASDGEDAIKRFDAFHPDLVLLDLGLPGISGLDLFHRFRRIAPQVPVIIATSRNEETDRIAGLEMGADDYVTKPFSPRELAARVRAVLRRVHRPDETPLGVLRAGGLVVRMDELRAELNGHPLHLSHQELSLLACLMRHPARIYTRDVLINAIYDGQTAVSDRTIDAQVKRLRQKISAVDPTVDPIQTLYGMGYKLRDGGV